MMNTGSGAARAEAPGCPFPLQGIDLHLHSTFSDGLKTPDELCRMAVKAGVSHVALCDHDTARGVPAMLEAAQKHGLCCIPGAELSAGSGGKTHILCYGNAVTGPDVQRYLETVGQERVQRAAAILQKLDELGMTIPQEGKAALLASPSVGRAHIARALIALGACNTMQQAFDRWLGEGRPAYVPRTQLPAEHAVSELAAMKVLPVLAHPMRMGLDLPAVHALVRSLKTCGLKGLECYHSSANAKTARALESIARQEGLLVTGGSDYHGDAGSTVHIGHLPSGWNSREKDLQALWNALLSI